MASPLPADDRTVPPAPSRRAALGWALAAAASRIPFLAHRLWDHDSVQFALGVEHFDLAAHQPHPPGYPLYIGLLKLLAALGVSPLHGMVALSVLAAAVGAAAMVLLVDRLARPEVVAPAVPTHGAHLAAHFAAALYVANPLLWFYGELPLVYAVEGGVTVVLAWAAVRMEEGAGRFLAAVVLFGLAGGLRPSTLVLLSPLFLFGLWRTWKRGRLTLRLFAGGALLGAGVVAAWLVPLLVASGGLAAYRRVSAAHFGTLLPETSILYGAGWGALAHNLTVIVKWALQGTLPGGLVLLALWLLVPAAVRSGLRLLRRRLVWLVAWAAPPVLFFALFHITKAGYTLVHLPALLAALALLAVPAFDGRRGRAAAASAAVLLLGGSLFLFGADRRPEEARWWVLVRNEFNRGSIRGYEADLDRMLAEVRRFPPETTVVATVELEGGGAAGSEGFLYPWQRHLQWYLPHYEVLYLVPEEGIAEAARGHRPFARLGREILLPPAARRLLFVLSGPTGERFVLPPAQLVSKSDHFLVLSLAVRPEMRLGPFELRPGPPASAPAPGGRAAPAYRPKK